MKCYSVAKYNLSTIKKSMTIFYSIFIISMIAMLLLMKIYLKDEGYSSGIEISTVIFMFITGIAIFKESFYFSQSNNISRKTYFKGTMLAIVPTAAIASGIDIIINRIYNVFATCPNIYDMGFTNFRDLDMIGIKNTWVQNNDILTLFNTFLFQFTIYIMIFIVGLTIALIYYKCNKLMKTVVSVLPVIFIILISSLTAIFPEVFNNIVLLINNMLGISTRNPHAPMATFMGIAIILSGVIYLLIKKTVIKER